MQMTDVARFDPPNSLSSARLQSDASVVRRYAELTADFNPIHLDPEFAAGTPFKTPIIHGTMGLNLLIKSIEATFGGSMPAAEIEIRFTGPVPVGSAIRAGGKLLDADVCRYEVFVETETGTRVIQGTLAVSSCATRP